MYNVYIRRSSRLHPDDSAGPQGNVSTGQFKTASFTVRTVLPVTMPIFNEISLFPNRSKEQGISLPGYNKLSTMELPSARDGPSNKMRIPASPQNNVEEHFSDDILTLLKNAIQEILEKGTDGLNFKELYVNAHTMVLHKHGARLYEGLREVVTQHLTNKVREDVLKSLNDNFLPTLNQNWNNYTISLVNIRDLLMYMDRMYVNQNNLENVYNLGLILFRDNVLRYGQIRDKLRDMLLDCIARERRGETIDRSSIKNACQMLMQVGIGARDVYEEDFERPFLQQSADFFKVEAPKCLMQNAACEYVQMVEQRLHEETERAKDYLDSSSEGHIVRVVEEELIVEHLNTVALMETGGVVYCIQNQKYDDMARMYRLFNRVPEGLTTMLQYIGSHLADQGKDLLTEEEASPTNPVVLVTSLLTLKDNYDKFLEKSFDNDPRFQTMISGAFENFLNLNRRSPKYLSLFIDEQLKKGNTDVTEQELEKVLDRAMTLMRFLHEKDVFKGYYTQHLTKRLLCNRSTSNDAEKMMIGKLKQECGDQFASQLEEMLKDITLAENVYDH